MKKFKYIFIFLLALIPMNIKAFTSKESATYMNNLISRALQNHSWNAFDSDNDRFSIEIVIGNTKDDEFLKNVVDGIPESLGSSVSFWDNSSALYKSSTYVYGCKNANNCDTSHADYDILFNLRKRDGDEIYLVSQYTVTKAEFDGFKSCEKIVYDIATNQKGIGGDVKKEGSFTNKIEAEENYDKTEGRVGNPKKITNETTIKIPDENDSFWDNASDNKCYYIQFDFESDNSYARFQISDRETALQKIYWGNDPVYTLASHLIEDCKKPGEGIFGVSKSNYYAICDAYGETINFKFIDNNQITACNESQQQEGDKQNGEGSTGVLTPEEQQELYNGKPPSEANDGSWDPNSLCGENNENCNIDITKFCTDPYVARTLKFLGLLLAIAKVLVPALIIGLGFVDLAKIVISGNVDEAKKQGINIIKRAVIGIVIFLIPTILITIYNVAYSIANDSEEVTNGELNVPTNFKNCVGCILDANNENSCIVNTND